MPATIAPGKKPARPRTRRKRRLPTVPITVEMPDSSGRERPYWSLQPRRGPALRPNVLTDLLGDEILGLNLTSGCLNQCSFCFARGYPRSQSNLGIKVYEDTSIAVCAEVERLTRRPRAVYLCPSCDPFPPICEVQSEAVRVVKVLADHRIESWIMTRGYIRPAVLKALAEHKQYVRITLPIASLDRTIQRATEMGTASPRSRIRQIVRLQNLGLRTTVAIEPLIPGLTDTRENLVPLVKSLAQARVQHLSVGYMFLRPGIRDNLHKEICPDTCVTAIEENFESGPFLSLPRTAQAKYVPLSARQNGYAHVMALAAEYGMTVSVSALLNPDLWRPKETRYGPDAAYRQMLLPGLR